MKPRPAFLRAIVPASLVALGVVLGACNAILGIDGAESGYTTGASGTAQGGAGTSSMHSGSGTGADSSSTGGGGPADVCKKAEDCPGMDDDCSRRACVGGKCLVVYSMEGTVVSKQQPHDCKKNVCDGHGGVTQVTDDSDLPDDGNPCTAEKCVGGQVVEPNEPVGTPCDNTKFCDGNGGCVQCTALNPCSGQMLCQQEQCVPQTCEDGHKDGNETDKDCGGPCGPCANGLHCAVNGDCQSKVCTSGVCAVPTCMDGVQNGNETDKDCGGLNCDPCPTGEGCMTNSDCKSGSCSGSTCLPTCIDGVKDGNETGVDCGDGVCPACPTGQGCNVGGDCQSMVCIGNVCKAPTCSDGRKNGHETDVDCGGADCPPCGPGKAVPPTPTARAATARAARARPRAPTA